MVDKFFWGDLSFVVIVLGADLWWGSNYLGFSIAFVLTLFIGRRLWYHYRPYETPPPPPVRYTRNH